MHFSASCPRLHLLLPAALREQREHWHLVSCLVSRSCCRQEAVDSWTSAVYYLLIRGVFNISDQVSPHWWRRQSDRKFLLYILYSTGQINIIRLFSFLFFFLKKKKTFSTHINANVIEMVNQLRLLAAPGPFSDFLSIRLSWKCQILSNVSLQPSDTESVLTQIYGSVILKSDAANRTHLIVRCSVRGAPVFRIIC